MISENEILNLIALSKVKNVGSVTAKNLISYCGSAEAVLKSKKHQLIRIPGIGEKTADEFIKIKNEEYVILSKVDDKVLVVPFEFDKGGKCHLLTSQYSFKNKYEGTYYYIDLNQYPIIKK